MSYSRNRYFRLYITVIAGFVCPCLFAQGALMRDSVPLSPKAGSLDTVVIRLWGRTTNYMRVPASVSRLGQREILWNGQSSLLSGMNMIPGVRMEERTPGSFRLSIRGSLLRSPFGVRNVKVYWDEWPFTDGGGNTYLNLLDPNFMSDVEVSRGPAGSLYGAGTGGVVLFGSAFPAPSKTDHGFELRTQFGSYGQWIGQAGWTFQHKDFRSRLRFGHQQSDGYRRHSALRRDLLSWDGQWKLGAKDSLSAWILGGDLRYETPGGLTRVQAEQDPRQARPSTPAVPGPEQQRAAVYNTTGLAALTYIHSYNPTWKQFISVLYSHTWFRNPFLTNYEIRRENNGAARLRWEWNGLNSISLQAGAEIQFQDADINNYGNRGGEKDTVQSQDKVSMWQAYPFVQANWYVYPKWMVQAGLSWNFNRVDYRRLTDAGSPEVQRSLDPRLLPRLSILFQPSATASFFVQYAAGYSPPGIAELRPSDGLFYGSLQSEDGHNLEAGVRTQMFHRQVRLEMSGYRFSLRDAIVRRQDANGAEYFVNAGSTSQWGMEMLAQYQTRAVRGPESVFRVWTTVSWNRYRFDEYQVDGDDYSGNRLTGVPMVQWFSGLRWRPCGSVSLQAGLSHASRIPLNDANSVYADGYWITGLRGGWEKNGGRVRTEWYLGVDNLTNRRYSLGHDINAFGGRYYNPAPERNFFLGWLIRI